MKFNNKNKEKTILVDTDKKLQEHRKVELHQVKNEAENIAVKNPPKTVEELKNTASTKRISTSFSSLVSEIGVIFNKSLQGFLTKYNQAVADFSSSEISEANANIKNIEKEKAAAIDEAVATHQTTITDKKEDLKTLKGTIKNLKISLSTMKSYVLWPKNVIGSVIILLILLGEIYMNSDSFEYAGFSQTYAKIIGLAVATVTFMLGITLAFFVKKDNWSKKAKVLASLGVLFLVSGLYYTLGSIRIAMMTAEGSSDGLFGLTAFHFLVFNLAFFTSIFAVKLFVFPSSLMVKANEAYYTMAKRIQNEEAKAKKLQDEINNAHTSREASKKRVIQEYKPTIIEANKRVADNLNAIKTTAISYNELLSKAQLFYTQVNSDYKTVSATFFSTLNLYRNDNISLPFPDTPDLENPFENYQTVKTFNGSQKP